MDRRGFIRSAGMLAVGSGIYTAGRAFPYKNDMKQIQVVRTDSDFEREKLLHPFGFKGAYLTELWQVASQMESGTGNKAMGLATQSVLYGDADLFARSSEAEGNALMYLLANKALQRVKETRFYNPVGLLEDILPQLHADAQQLTGMPEVNVNFVYNALISVDNAAWLLYAAENGYTNFDDMIPPEYRPALGHRNKQVGILYQVSYNMPVQQLKQAAEEGYFLFKIKTGYPGSQEVMLQKDMEGRFIWHKFIHENEPEYHFARRMKRAPDGHFLICGYYGPYGSRGYASKINAAGEEVMQLPLTGLRAWDCLITQDGGWLITGDHWGNNIAMLAKFDRTGTLQWTNQYALNHNGPDNRSSARSSVETADGGFAFVGFASTIAPWLVKTDQYGKTVL